jgi:hypothetical protein
MKKFIPFFLPVVFTFIGCQRTEAQLQIQNAFPKLNFEQPVDIQKAEDESNRLFVLEQKGIISVFPNSSDVSTKNVFLDISSKVISGGELGLLGLAFHPEYKKNGYFYIDYTTDNPRRTVISRFKVGASDPNKADPNSEVILLEVNQPYANHNGGQISFGPDGYLYISFGDGGSAGDPQNNAQNLKSFLGKILRIDVNKNDPEKNYSIPENNPFKGNTSGYYEEIFAYGLRNAWRFSFDSQTEQLWAADVGQNAWEEIDLIEPGGNYGWRCYEGGHNYNSTGCNSINYILPIWEYGHNSNGGFSITGGYVYRGSTASEIYGKYVYADYVSGRIWSLEKSGSSYRNSLLFSTSHAISTFGRDEKGELYFASYALGTILKFSGSPSTETGSINLPEKFILDQNYPNPFNPSTAISWQIAITGYTTLKIFDVLGREMGTLVNEMQMPGFYTTRFSAFGYQLASGIYFYTLSSGNFSQTKSMVFLK